MPKHTFGSSRGFNPKEVAPIPTQADLKILWARAAGRCAMCKDKKELTLDRENDDAVTLGEVCHIVGEKISAARGKERLPIKVRGAYSNLILLCANDHKLIDRNPTKYTVAILHDIKDSHEHWVTEKLAITVDPADLVLAHAIDVIDRTLPFICWRSFTDDALRMIVHSELIDSRGVLNEMILRTLWPKKFPKLKRSIVELVSAFNDWITLYEANAQVSDHSELMRPIRGWKRTRLHLRSPYEENEEVWARACYARLSDFVAKLNRFANVVRETINPLYRNGEGKFLLYDDMGHWNKTRPTIIETTLAGSARLVAHHVRAANRLFGT